MAWVGVALLVCEPLEDFQDRVGLEDGEPLALVAVDGGDLEVDVEATFIGHAPTLPCDGRQRRHSQAWYRPANCAHPCQLRVKP